MYADKHKLGTENRTQGPQKPKTTTTSAVRTQFVSVNHPIKSKFLRNLHQGL